MALLANEKEKIVGKFQRTDNDTGSPEVQIALLTENINKLQKAKKIRRLKKWQLIKLMTKNLKKMF